VAALVPIEDLELLERLEDQLDIEAADRAMADPENQTPHTLGGGEGEAWTVDRHGLRDPLRADRPCVSSTRSCKTKVQITRRIAALADDPRPAGVKMLQGQHGYYRIRSGDYRVIYMIEDDVLVVLVVKVGHRREVYRK